MLILNQLRLFLCLGLCLSPHLLAADSSKEPKVSPMQAESQEALRTRSISLPPIRIFRSHQSVYRSPSRPHLLIILHVPKEKGPAFVELYNKTKEDLGIFKVSLSALGDEGEIDFDDLPKGWSAVKEVKLSSLWELAFRNARAFNQNADEIYPEVLIHQVEWTGNKPKVGKAEKL